MRYALIILVLASGCTTKHPTHYQVSHHVHGKLAKSDFNNSIQFGSGYKEFFRVGDTACNINEDENGSVIACHESAATEEQTIASTTFNCSLNDSEKNSAKLTVAFPKSDAMQLKVWCE